MVRTEGLKATVCVCTSCTVNNQCEFEHSSSHGECNFDARLVKNKRKDHTINSEIRQDDLCSPTQVQQEELKEDAFTSCKVFCKRIGKKERKDIIRGAARKEETGRWSGGRGVKICKKIFQREEDRQGKEEGKARERKRKTRWSIWNWRKWFVSPPLDDRAHSGGS